MIEETADPGFPFGKILFFRRDVWEQFLHLPVSGFQQRQLLLRHSNRTFQTVHRAAVSGEHILPAGAVFDPVVVLVLGMKGIGHGHAGKREGIGGTDPQRPVLVISGGTVPVKRLAPVSPDGNDGIRIGSSEVPGGNGARLCRKVLLCIVFRRKSELDQFRDHAGREAVVVAVHQSGEPPFFPGFPDGTAAFLPAEWHGYVRHHAAIPRHAAGIGHRSEADPPFCGERGFGSEHGAGTIRGNGVIRYPGGDAAFFDGVIPHFIGHMERDICGQFFDEGKAFLLLRPKPVVSPEKQFQIRVVPACHIPHEPYPVRPVSGGVEPVHLFSAWNTIPPVTGGIGIAGGEGNGFAHKDQPLDPGRIADDAAIEIVIKLFRTGIQRVTLRRLSVEVGIDIDIQAVFRRTGNLCIDIDPAIAGHIRRLPQEDENGIHTGVSDLRKMFIRKMFKLPSGVGHAG